MAKYNIFKLKNLTPLHIGLGKQFYDFSSQEVLSDTLSSALAAIYATMYSQVKVDEFLKSFTLSSAFPFIRDEFFLPKPSGRVNISVSGVKEVQYRKKLKNLKFISKSIWGKLIDGTTNSVQIDDEQLQGEFLFSNTDDKISPYCTDVHQRVSVSRDENIAPSPFFFEWKYFNKECGLYCITSAKGDKLIELEKLFSALGQQGLGSGKNIGGGKFDVEVSAIELPDVQDANACILLSMFIPTQEELKSIDLAKSCYELNLRGGFIAGADNESLRHLWKKSIYMFKSSSVLVSTKTLVGKVVDLRPEWNDETLHNVYRSGIAFCLPIKIKE